MKNRVRDELDELPKGRRTSRRTSRRSQEEDTGGRRKKEGGRRMEKERRKEKGDVTRLTIYLLFVVEDRGNTWDGFCTWWWRLWRQHVCVCGCIERG